MTEQEEFEFRARAETEQARPVSQKQGLMRRGWEALKIPEQMSRQGLQQLASFIPKPEPTGNRFMDILKGTPRIAADTLAEAAPGFVSRGSLLAAGAAPALKAAGPLAGAAGRGLAGQLESLSGAKPGVLTEAFKDPSLIFSTIPKAAREAYQAENPALEASKLVTENPRPFGMIMKARRMAAEGKLSAGEALAARKNVDQLWESKAITKDFKNATRKVFDAVVKEKEALAEADKSFSRGMKAASLRNLLPQNKYGGASPFKMAMGGIATHGGIPGKAIASLMSPAVQGAGATALGAASKVTAPIATNPAASITLLQILKRLRGQDANPNPLPGG